MRSLAIVLLFAACSADSSGSPDPDRPTGGAELYAFECAGCHGDGSGTEDGPTILNPVVGYATFVVRRGRAEMGFPNPMPAIDTSTVTDPELTAILDYLGAAVKPTTGAELYQRFCENCHGADGKSGRVRKNIVREAGEIVEKVRQGSGGTNYGSRTSYMPRWTATEITDAELALIRTYVLSL